MNTLSKLNLNKNGIGYALIGLAAIPVLAVSYVTIRRPKSAEVKIGPLSVNFKD